MKKHAMTRKLQSAGERHAVARNHSTPASTLADLAKDRDWDVRLAAAENPSTPVNALKRFARYKVGNRPDLMGLAIRTAAAGNPSTPANVLADLAKDADTNVRYAAARNPSTPAGVLA